MKNKHGDVTQTVVLSYPASAGDSFVLRTDGDWEADIAATSVSDDRSTWTFQVRTREPFFYFKPILRREGQTFWARGDNRFAVVNPKAPVAVAPFFLEDNHCSVCVVQPPLSAEPGTDGAVQHRFRVFLPPGYRENSRATYPVLYMHDGQNLFLKEEAFLGDTWKTDEVLNTLDAMNAIEEVLVVGIYPNDRMIEYTNPGYGPYGRFLTDVLKPFIDANYRTRPGPDDTAIMGSSLGGVAAFAIGWNRPDVFGKVACLSSTFAYRDDLMDRVLDEPRRALRVYLDSGWPRDNYEATRSMSDRLRSRGWKPGQDLMYLAFPLAEHTERSWAERSPIPMQFLFGSGWSEARPA